MEPDFFSATDLICMQPGTHGAWRARMRTISGALAMSAASTPALPFDPATVQFDPLPAPAQPPTPAATGNGSSIAQRPMAESCREFLGVLVTEEIAHRQQTRIQRSVRQARFPFLKTVEEFDFSFQSSVRLPSLGSYLGPELVSGGRNLILQGKSGRGKSHLVIAIAYRAIQNGFTARFVTAAVLIESLSVASRQGRLQEQLAHYLQPHVLVIDEVGYLSYGPDAATSCSTWSTNATSAAARAVHHQQASADRVDEVLRDRPRRGHVDRVHSKTVAWPARRHHHRGTRHLDLSAQDAHDGLHQPARISEFFTATGRSESEAGVSQGRAVDR